MTFVPGGKGTHMKGVGMFVVSLRSVNFGFLPVKVSFRVAREKIYRGYYMVARRYEFYFREAKQYFTNERSE